MFSWLLFCVFLEGTQNWRGKERIASKESGCCRLYLIEKQLKDNQVYLIHLERHEGEKRWRTRKRKEEEFWAVAAKPSVNIHTVLSLSPKKFFYQELLIWIKEISGWNQFLQSLPLFFYSFCFVLNTKRYPKITKQDQTQSWDFKIIIIIIIKRVWMLIKKERERGLNSKLLERDDWKYRFRKSLN